MHRNRAVLTSARVSAQKQLFGHEDWGTVIKRRLALLSSTGGTHGFGGAWGHTLPELMDKGGYCDIYQQTWGHCTVVSPFSFSSVNLRCLQDAAKHALP